MSSLAARAAERAVHPDHVEEFVNSPIPRFIPARILEQTTPRANCIFIVFFAIWAVMGLPWLIIGALNLDRGGIDAIIMGLLIELLAAVALNFTISYRRRKQRLLRNGVLTHATITDLKPTNVESNGSQRYIALVRYKAGETTMNESISLYGTHVDLARNVIENAEQAPLLYDPRKPQNCLLGLQLTSQRMRL